MGFNKQVQHAEVLGCLFLASRKESKSCQLSGLGKLCTQQAQARAVNSKEKTHKQLQAVFEVP